MLAEIVDHTGAQSGALFSSDGVGRLIINFGAELQVWQYLLGDRPRRFAEILRSATLIDLTSAAAKDGPLPPRLPDQERQQERNMTLATSRRAARKKHSWKDADIPADAVLAQKAVFGGKFDIAEAHECSAS